MLSSSLYANTLHGMLVVCKNIMPLFEVRRSVNKINDRRTSNGTEDKCSLVQQIHA